MKSSRRHLLVVTIAATGIALVAPPSTAQAQIGPRWQAWIGCWAPVVQASNSSSTNNATSSPPIVCVTPTSDVDVVDVSAIADGKVVSRDKIDASGRTQTIDANGCTGTTRANWSSDQRRVFLRSSVSCQGQPSETSAILAMANNNGGEWIDARSVTAGGNSEVRVARYRDAGIPGALPADLASALRNRSMAVRNARLASTAQIAPRDIVEASHSADAPIVEAWLLESGQQYAVDARTLRELADAGVPSGVTDAMVSVSNSSSQSSDTRYNADGERVVERVVEREVVHTYDPWGYGYGYYPAPYPVRYRPYYSYSPVVFSFSLFGFGHVPYGYPYSPFGYYPYGHGYRPVAYTPFGFGFGSSYGRHYYRPPVVIGRPYYPQPGNPRVAHPRVVRDQGFTEQRSSERHYDSAPRTAVERPRTTTQSDGRSRAPAAQPASARPSNGSTSGSSGGGERRAHGRH
ncbi:MAG: hypothetical protein ABJE10_14040 [bacterium]